MCVLVLRASKLEISNEIFGRGSARSVGTSAGTLNPKPQTRNPQPITVTALIMPRINKVIVLVNEITVTALIVPRINKETHIF